MIGRIEQPLSALTPPPSLPAGPSWSSLLAPVASSGLEGQPVRRRDAGRIAQDVERRSGAYLDPGDIELVVERRAQDGQPNGHVRRAESGRSSHPPWRSRERERVGHAAVV